MVNLAAAPPNTSPLEEMRDYGGITVTRPEFIVFGSAPGVFAGYHESVLASVAQSTTVFGWVTIFFQSIGRSQRIH
jgi:hypothetical protein